jgi:hypothetical protein
VHFPHIRDETVEVGATLYELDTDAVASVSATTAATAAESISSTKVEKTTSETKHSTLQLTATSDHRSPSIKFLGKDGWEALRKGQDVSKQALNGAVSSNLSPHAVTTIIDDKKVKNPMYGRPKFTEAEIDALLSGGATLAPQVLSHSAGAKFKL